MAVTQNGMMKAWAANLASRDGLLRRHSRASLVSYGRDATPLLVGLFEDERNQVRWEAAIALLEIGDPAAVDALILALEDKDEDVRWVAAEALIAIGEPAVKSLLHELVDTDGASVTLQKGAHHVFYKLADEELRDTTRPVLRALGGPNPSTEVGRAARLALQEMD